MMTPSPDRQRIVRPTTPRATSEMNITPMIDVLLVLLVIFMAALPLSQRALDVNLPPESDRPTSEPRDSQIVVEYTANRQILVNKQAVVLADLGPRLQDIYRSRRDKTLFLMGDGKLPYGDVVAVIDAAKGAGVDKVGVVTESMRRKPDSRR